MPIDLDSLKSAQVIDDPAEIERVLLERDEQATKSDGPCGDTAFTRSDDGSLRIEKTLTTNAREGAPKMPGTDRLRELAVSRGIAWKDEHAERVVPYWASDARVDSHGDIVLQNWNFDVFARNPVLPFGHNWHLPPIGNAIDWSVVDRKSKEYKGPALYLLGLFATADESDEADRIFRLIKAGFLKAGSVGFRSRRIIRVEDEDERSKLGLGRWGVILDDNQLLEFSPTTLGANHGALTILSQAKSAGLVKANDFDTLREADRGRIQRTTGDADAWREVDSKWVQIARTLFPDVPVKAHADFDAPIVQCRNEGPPIPSSAKSSDEDIAERLTRIEAGLEALTFGLGTRVDDLADKVDAFLETAGIARNGPSAEPDSGDAVLEAFGDPERTARIRDALARRRAQ